MDIDGWIRSALEPLEPAESNDEHDGRRGGITEVGSESVARALMAIRSRIQEEEEERDAIPTAPPPPQSDIRMIGGTRCSHGEDPLALYAEALGAPTLPPPRTRRETVKLPPEMRPRQSTLVMIDRPAPNALSPATPPRTIVPMTRVPLPAEPPPPRPFRGHAPVLALAFVLGSGLAFAAAVLVSQLHLW